MKATPVMHGQTVAVLSWCLQAIPFFDLFLSVLMEKLMQAAILD